MFKTLRNLTAGAILLLGGWGGAQAAVVTNTTDQLFNAVNEVSSTIRVAPFAELSVFVSGTYEDANTMVLQREVGSPGSGAFEDVQTVTTGTADARVVTRWTAGPNPSSYRLKMSATGTGDVVAYLTDHAVTARTLPTLSTATEIVFFDDFFGENNDGSLTVVNPSLYVTTQGADSEGTIGAVATAVHEGGATLISGDNAVGSEICISMVDEATSGALPSDGDIVFEVRFRPAEIDGLTYMTLQAQNCTASGTVDVMIDIDSGVVAQLDANNADMAGIARQDEATDTDDWQSFSSLIDVEGSNALEVPLGTATPINTYITLRVEVDTAGDAYFYVAGTLQHAEALAVTPGTRLIPSVVVAETAAGGGTVTMVIDYWMFVVPRPAT